jgi:hypothetical protein
VPPQLAALAVEDGAGQGVAPLTAAKKVVDGPPVGRVVGVFEHVQGLDHPAELGQGTGEAGRAGAALQGAQDRRGDDGTSPQRGGEPADLVPVVGNEPEPAVSVETISGWMPVWLASSPSRTCRLSRWVPGISLCANTV